MQDTNRLIIGIGFVVIGVSLFFEQVGMANIFSFSQLVGTFWPLIFIALAVSQLSKRSIKSGLILLTIGTLFQISTLFDINVWGLLWPLIIIGIGFSILLKDTFSFGSARITEDSDDEIDESIAFWGLEKKVLSQDFRGGKLNCYFGGAEIDLTETKLSSEGAVFNINCAFGGVEIRVPTSYKVVTNGSPVFAAWENNYRTENAPDMPVLKIIGSVTFGAIEVKN